MNRHSIKLTLIVGASLLLLSGVGAAQRDKQNAAPQPDKQKAATPPAQNTPPAQSTAAPVKAIAILHPTEGNKVHGWVTFYKEGNGLKVTAHIEGLAPGKHGFHIHEYGDCSSKDGMAAGGHYNPANKQHGDRMDTARHTGDLGNLEVGQDGMGHTEFTDTTLKLEGAGSILGRAVIVHAQPDDLKSQPAGNAGSRQACGVIGVAKP